MIIQLDAFAQNEPETFNCAAYVLTGMMKLLKRTSKMYEAILITE